MRRKILTDLDLIFIALVAILFLSCVATTYHTAETLQPGQGSISQGYMGMRSIEDFSETPVRLLGSSARIGATDRLEFGLEHVLDISKDNDNQFGSIWGDFKIQLTNKRKIIKKPILSTGLLKGYTYHSEAQIHITTIPVLLTLKPSERLSSTFQYRLSLFDESFLPTNLESPRHTFTLGLEYGLHDPSPEKWYPKLALSIGTINSLFGDPDDPNILILNLGLKFNTPYKAK